MAGVGCVTKVELSISCENVRCMDVTSKSDPICVVKLYEDASESWYEVARTEHIKNSLNPVFSKKIELDYYFEEVQKLKFKVHDVDNSSVTLKDDDFLGEMKCTLANIVSAKTYRQPLRWKDKKTYGTIVIKAEEINDNRELTLTVKGTKLDNKDVIGKSDPFLEFWREGDDGTWSLAHRSDVIMNTLDPVWKPMLIPVQALCGGNAEKRVKVVCKDWDSDGGHDLIGEFFTSLSQLEKCPLPTEFALINEKKKAKKSSYKNSGVLHILGVKIERSYSFLDYVFGGLQINFTVGVDFTGSNGDPRSPESLHYHHPGVMNEYVQALWGVGNVVQDYDTDKLFPAFGFGAKIPPNDRVSHEFPLNFNVSNPYCSGVTGVVQAYQQAILKVKLWGPTNLSPIINHVARFAYGAQQHQTSPQSYFILLLITDGVITDSSDTITAIVNASNLPMSIIIVGVGAADFGAMEMLDGDNGVLKAANGQSASRDIVQFVPFRDMKKHGPAGLAKAVLAEVPAQVTRYFKQKGMDPGAPTAAQQAPQ